MFIKNIKKISHIDLHTGLGNYGFDTLLFDKETEKDLEFLKSMGNHSQTSLDPNYIGYNALGICKNLFSFIDVTINMRNLA